MSEDQLSLLSSPSISRRLERLIVAIPAIAVLGLAMLYAVGALLKAAQLEGAGLSISDTLSLLPLETILGAGIGVVIRSAVLLIGIALVVLCGVVLMRWVFARIDRRVVARDKKINDLRRRVDALDQGRSDFSVEANRLAEDIQRQKRQDGIRSRASKILFALGVVVSAGTLLIFTPVVAVAYAVSILGIAILAALKVSLRRVAPLYIGTQYIVLLAAYVVSAFIYPTPLPQASIKMRNHVVSGELVAVTSTAWYLANSYRIEAIPVERIDRAAFVSRYRPRPASVGTHLLQSLGIE